MGIPKHWWHYQDWLHASSTSFDTLSYQGMAPAKEIQGSSDGYPICLRFPRALQTSRSNRSAISSVVFFNRVRHPTLTPLSSLSGVWAFDEMLCVLVAEVELGCGHTQRVVLVSTSGFSSQIPSPTKLRHRRTFASCTPGASTFGSIKKERIEARASCSYVKQTIAL